MNLARPWSEMDPTHTFPWIACLITQYNIGWGIDINPVARSTANWSMDYHHAQNVCGDTEDFRLECFDTAINTLTNMIIDDVRNNECYKSVV